METIRQWLHANLINTQETPAKLYRSYTAWLQKRNLDIAPVSYSLFRTQIQNISLIERSEEVEVGDQLIIPEPIIKESPKVEVQEDGIEEVQQISETETEVEEMDEEIVFEQIENYTRSVANRDSKDYALIVSGDPGLGKTVSVTNILKEVLGEESEPRQFIDIDETNEFIIEEPTTEDQGNLTWMDSPVKVSPLQLFIFLYRENGKVLLFDDADSLIEDPGNFNILKKVLDSKPKRSISYGSKPIIMKKASIEGKDVIIPNNFEFEGRIIVVTNKPFHKIDKAIKSRSLLVEVDLSAAQCLKRVKRLLPYLLKDDRRATPEVKQEVLDYLLSISDLFKKIDLRTVEQSIEEYFRSPTNWKVLVKQSIVLKNKEKK